MPRRSRKSSHVVGALCHVICRFVDYRFVLDDEGRDVYLRFLGAALRATDWVLISYALMSSHVHLGLLVGRDPLGAWAHPLNQRFASWQNHALRGAQPRVLGPVFADRPSTKTIALPRTRVLLAYHHRNPMSAGVVADAAHSTWTSHRAYIDLSEPQAGLRADLGLRYAGFDRTKAGRREFHAYVMGTSVAAGDLLGADLDDPAPQDVHGSPLALDPARVIRLAAQVCNEPIEGVLAGSRRRAPVRVRRVALVAWTSLGGPMSQIAMALRISAPAASQLLSRPHDVATVQKLAEDVRLGFQKLTS